MRHLDLFSGIGGFSLAAEWAGFETAMFCEVDPFCREVLGKHWPHVPIHDDIRTLTGELVGDVELITGGFPCQPFSVAGKRRGAADDRHLWPEMARVIGECRPRWVLGENTPGIIGLALDDCLADLESLGYEAWPVVVPACGVGAWHRRERVWIVAHSGRELLQGVGVVGATPRPTDGGEGAAVPDTAQGRLRCGGAPGQAGLAAQLREASHEGRPAHHANGRRHGAPDGQLRPRWNGAVGSDWWELESGVRGVPDGLSRGVDRRAARLKSLGNAIVPQVAYVILQSMLETEAEDQRERAA